MIRKELLNKKSLYPDVIHEVQAPSAVWISNRLALPPLVSPLIFHSPSKLFAWQFFSICRPLGQAWMPSTSENQGNLAKSSANKGPRPALENECPNRRG